MNDDNDRAWWAPTKLEKITFGMGVCVGAWITITAVQIVAWVGWSVAQ